MRQLLFLMRHDLLLLWRNKMVAVSVVVTLLYMLSFQAISGWGEVDKLLVLVIFNDPALLGFLFVGVMLLFEKNEGSLQALAATPVSLRDYLLSKAGVLTAISVLCCYAMALAARGTDFHMGHFFFASALTTLVFSFIGFAVVAGLDSFNRYIVRAIGVVLLLLLPFLGYFGLLHTYWFLPFPTMPLIELYAFSFRPSVPWAEVLSMYALSVCWCLITYHWARRAMGKDLFRA